MRGRVDFEKYPLAGETVENVLALPQGGVARRAGSRFIKEVKNSAKRSYFTPFEYSTTQAYMLEDGDKYLRFYKNQAQIVANNITASIANGTFDTAITSWTDESSGGSATRQHASIGSSAEGTFDFSSSGTDAVGDLIANGLNWGMQFVNELTGTVNKVTINVASVVASFNAVAKLYTDSSGQPGVIVGSNSDTTNLNGTGDQTFTWTTPDADLSAGTTYWVVITDTTGGGTGSITVTTVADQGSLFKSGNHDTITSIDDQSGSFPAANDHKFKIELTSPTPMLEGTFAVANSAADNFGDSISNGLNYALMFPNTDAGTVTKVRVEVITHFVTFGAVAKIYTDSSGSPGTQVNGNSDTLTLSTAGDKSFVWSTNPPALSASTTYWVVLSDTTGGGTGHVSLSLCTDQGATFGYGTHDTITSIVDRADAFDLRAEITVSPSAGQGVMELVGDAGETAAAEQAVTITETATEHILAFQILGVQNDVVKLRIGSATGGTDIVNDRIVEPGWHRVAFTPGVTTVYVQFRNEMAKNVQIDNVSILDNVALEITTPYGTADLPGLKWAQSADELYFFHPSYAPYKLQRRSHTDWALVQITWADGPYLDENTTSTTFAVNTATVGKGRTLTVSATEGVNSETGLQSTDVGRLFRISHTTNEPGWGIITAVASTTSATVDIIRAINATSAQTTWRLGSWSDTTGWPTTGAFFEQRLAAAGTTNQPQTFWLSQSADLENMRPDSFVSSAVVIEDDDALDYTIAAEKVNAILWLSPEKELIIGTIGGEWSAKSDASVITPTDITVKRETAHGSADISPIRVGGSVLFLQAGQRKLRELLFSFDVDGHVARDLTVLSDHITEGGIDALAYAQEPDSVVWCVRSDGTLCTMTFKPEENVFGWARQVMGGSFSSGDAVVEDVATIPGNNGAGQVEDSTGRDEVWVMTKRTINSAEVRFIEVIEKAFEGPILDDFSTAAAWRAQVLTEQKDSYFVDSMLTYDDTATTSITGLSHLEGEAVVGIADGVVFTGLTVSSGAITLSTAASKVQVGLAYTHRYRSLKQNFGASSGSAVGKKKRLNALTAVLLSSASFSYGDSLIGTMFTSTNPNSNVFSGERRLPMDSGWSGDERFAFSGANSLPWTLLAVAPEMSTNDLL